LLVPATVTVISERRKLAPWGAAGGLPGARGRNARVDGKTGRVHELPGKFQQRFEAGDRLIVESPGGGGYGMRGRRK
jgi:N-methylhydantoinase B/oxoprolinase/acetone carboxylase alpha subunit